MRDLNKVYCDNWLNNGLPDKAVKFLIADPPYYEVKGEFDFIWPTFEDYLKDVEKWAAECKRVLADNGTLLWYGDAKNIAYSQIILDKHFNLLNNGRWEKTDCQTRKNRAEDQRSFIPITESWLLYDNGEDKSGLARIDDDPELYMSLKIYFDNWLKSSGMTLKDAVEKIGSSCSHWFGFSERDKTQFSFPTKDKWDIMESILPNRTKYIDLKKNFEDLRLEYEDLRLQYEDLRRYFSLQDGFKHDIIKTGQESHITKQYDHDTKKPETLTRAFILTCSKKGDLIAIPFAGSGTECAMSAKEGRPFIGFDIEQKHVDTSNKRCGEILRMPTMF